MTGFRNLPSAYVFDSDTAAVLALLALVVASAEAVLMVSVFAVVMEVVTSAVLA